MQTDTKQGERTRMAASVAELPWGKIDLSSRAGDQIYAVLRGAILDLQLPPRCPVSEAEIGAKLGASRTPVREALVRLREEGLITTLPNRGSFVAPLSRQRILETQFLREAIEVSVVRRLAAVGLDAENRNALAANLAVQRAAAEAADYPRFHALDDAFHAILARATGFERVATVLEREKVQLDRLRCLSLRVEGHLQLLVREHQAVFDAVVAQDVAAAEAHMKTHCRSVLTVLEELSQSHLEYFE